MKYVASGAHLCSVLRVKKGACPRITIKYADGEHFLEHSLLKIVSTPAHQNLLGAHNIQQSTLLLPYTLVNQFSGILHPDQS